MKLKIHNSAPREFKELLIEAFPLVTKHLGIDGYNATIELRFETVHGEEGATGPNGTLDLLRRLKVGKRCIDYGMTIKPQNVPDMFATFCHEMVHIKQWVTGELTVQIKPNGLPQQLYYNVKVEQDKIPYMDRPWEKEAFDKMYPIATAVMKQIVTKIEREQF